MIMGVAAVGGWRAKSETARPAHSQPAPPLLTVSARPNRTKHTPNREQTMNSQHDHGSAAGGAWRDKSEAPPSAPGSMIPGRSQSPRLEDPRDHGSGAGGTVTSP